MPFNGCLKFKLSPTDLTDYVMLLDITTKKITIIIKWLVSFSQSDSSKAVQLIRNCALKNTKNRN